MGNLDHLVQRFEESKQNFIECEALYHGSYNYIVAKQRQPRKPRQKKWYLWIEIGGKIRGSLRTTKSERLFKDILLTDDPSCKGLTKISNDFFFARNNYYDAHKQLLFDPETNTLFSFAFGRSEEQKILLQIFQVNSES